MGVSRAKRNALVLVAFGVLLIILVAMSLANLKLMPGQPLPLGQFQLGMAANYPEIPGGDLFVMVMQGIVALALILLPVYVIYSLLTAEGRQRLVVHVVMIAALLLIASYLRDHRQGVENGGLLQNSRSANPFVAGSQSGQAQAEPVFSADPPAWLSAAIILGISIIVAMSILGVTGLQRRRTNRAKSPLLKVAQEAQSAIDSLQAGADFRQTIIRCYHDMMWVVKVEKGIERDSAMTPREFEEHLAKQGLPREALQRLTRLFEQVRYGSQSASTREDDEAFACLTEILNACHTIGQRA